MSISYFNLPLSSEDLLIGRIYDDRGNRARSSHPHFMPSRIWRHSWPVFQISNNFLRKKIFLLFFEGYDAQFMFCILSATLQPQRSASYAARAPSKTASTT
jgi:hypothetical protein